MKLRSDGRLLRVGHKGAAALAPENTLESLERAVELGCDLVEFDVLDLHDGTLVLAHSDDLWEVSHGSARGRVRGLMLDELRAVAPGLPTLDEALSFFAREATGTGLQLDLKPRGHEPALVDALRRHGLVERSLVSSFDAQSLRELARLEPGLRLLPEAVDNEIASLKLEAMNIKIDQLTSEMIEYMNTWEAGT